MRFSLQTLLLAVVVVASATGAFGVAGFVFALIGLGLAGYVSYIPTTKSTREAAIEGILIAGIFTVLILLTLPPFRRSGHPQSICQGNLMAIGLALQNYHDAHGCFPPAYIADENGNPMHSWRVLILPYLEQQQALYDQYDFSEPWNGPNNRRLAGRMPDQYTCYRNRGTAPVMTGVLAVVGPRTAWHDSEPVRSQDISDGMRNTIQVVEIADSDVHWMEPRDLSLEAALAGVDPASGCVMFGPHGGASTFVTFADGRCRAIPNDVAPELLEAALTANGGETVDGDRFDFWAKRQREAARRRWAHRFAVAALILSSALLLARPWVRSTFARLRR